MGNQFYIEFNTINEDVFKRLKSLFIYISKAKDRDIQIDNLERDEKIFDFYLNNELEYFWWPTSDENKAFWNKYKVLNDEEKKELLDSVAWDFETVFSEIGYGEYQIRSCTLIGENIARLYFEPIAFPYGGSKPLQEALKAFSVKIIKVCD